MITKVQQAGFMKAQICMIDVTSVGLNSTLCVIRGNTSMDLT